MLDLIVIILIHFPFNLWKIAKKFRNNIIIILVMKKNLIESAVNSLIQPYND